MKKVRYIMIPVMLAASSFAQQLHTTAEILKMLTGSKVTYQVGTLENPVECQDYSGKLNFNDCYRVVNDSGIYTYAYKINEKAKSLFGKAEDFFEKSNTDSALCYYKLSFEADSGFYQALTYIGQMYETKKDFGSAMKWYRKAIEKNYIDYMAHWFLADNCEATNHLAEAVDEITIARILNRNNPRIRVAYDDIYRKAKRDTADWCFNPQILLDKDEDDTVHISYEKKWLGYALAKALWTYEPGYREKMGASEGMTSIKEEEECLIATLTGIENAKIRIKKDPQLRILKEAAENKHLDDYIIYEIWLPRHPAIAYQLSGETIMNIKDYILKIRNPK